MRKNLKTFLNLYCTLNVVLISFAFNLQATATERFYYQLKIYHLKTLAQEERVDNYLQNAYLPALHRMGVKEVGVFKPVESDSSEKKVYVLTPFSSWDQLENCGEKLMSDKEYATAGTYYINANYKDLPYSRLEVIVLKAFPKMPEPAVPDLSSKKTDRVYELRSYESATEAYNVNKVKMFNDGNEVALFKRLNFNAVFYAEVLAGSHMPNLMYMTTFENKEDRDKHWDTFTNDTEWKTLVAKPGVPEQCIKSGYIFPASNCLLRFLNAA